MNSTASGRTGLIRRLVLLSLSVVPCVFAFGWSAWPLYAIWAALGGARIRQGDHKALQDSLFFGSFNILLSRRDIVDAFTKRWEVSTVLTALAIAVAVVAVESMWYIFESIWSNDNSQEKQLPTGTRPWTLEHPKSYIIPCRTTHARIFPKKHSFGYDYLLCGFPIVPARTTPEGVDLPDDSDRILGKWWLRIRAEDYLTRGQAAFGFYGKLKVFLREKVT
jgi:hypothetical protein